MTIGPVWLMQPIPYFNERLSGTWIYEPKIDGWRMQIISYKIGRVELWGRRLERNPNWTGKLNMLAKLLAKYLPGRTVLDCELYSTGGRRFIPSLFAKKPKVKPIVFVFDILYYNGHSVYHQPLAERKKLLKILRLKKPFSVIQGNTLIDIPTDFNKAIHAGHEGIVIKHMDSPYRIGDEIKTQDDFIKQIESRFCATFKQAWKEAIKICKEYDRSVLLSQRYFYETIYKPRRDKLAKKWTEESQNQ